MWFRSVHWPVDPLLPAFTIWSIASEVLAYHCRQNRHASQGFADLKMHLQFALSNTNWCNGVDLLPALQERPQICRHDRALGQHLWGHHQMSRSLGLHLICTNSSTVQAYQHVRAPTGLR